MVLAFFVGMLCIGPNIPLSCCLGYGYCGYDPVECHCWNILQLLCATARFAFLCTRMCFFITEHKIIVLRKLRVPDGILGFRMFKLYC